MIRFTFIFCLSVPVGAFEQNLTVLPFRYPFTQLAGVQLQSTCNLDGWPLILNDLLNSFQFEFRRKTAFGLFDVAGAKPIVALPAICFVY
jgi:hypothetical protein